MSSREGSVQKEIAELSGLIVYHSHRYYVLDDPEISDPDFDELFEKCEKDQLVNPRMTIVSHDKVPHYRFDEASEPPVGGMEKKQDVADLDETVEKEKVSKAKKIDA